MTEFKGDKGNWTFTRQRGTINHCTRAQIWTDAKEEYVATLGSTKNESEANATVKLMTASKELLEQHILNIKRLEEVKSMLGNMTRNTIKKYIDLAIDSSNNAIKKAL